MPILVRHTTPDIPSGICYGQSDIQVTNSFEQEAKAISQQLPTQINKLYYSPLLRCKHLALFIQEHHEVDSYEAVPQLMEMHFGDWEMVGWNDIEKEALDGWMHDFVYKQVPSGESFATMHQRVIAWWQKMLPYLDDNSVIITHAGPIRSILSFTHNTLLTKAFELYKVPYGMVKRVTPTEIT